MGLDLLIVTVTMNAAIDRTLTVPNFQRGQRHRASAGLSLAGGKGINIARALKRLGVPVVATGLAGGRTGIRIVEELTGEAILNDFVRIDDESRTSTAIVDPTGGSYTEVNEWGPHVSAEELEMLLEKLVYLSQGADYVVFSGSLPRGIDDGFYAEAVRELNRRGARTVLDSEGEPLRLGVQAEPLLVSPNEREAEALVGQEFNDDDDFLTGLETIAELGARNVLITRESGCWALLRAERETSRFRAVAPRVDPISAVGSGDVLLAAFVAARLDGRSDEEALRSAVAAGAASTLEIGAGRFEPREAGRLISSVEVAQLEPVGSECSRRRAADTCPAMKRQRLPVVLAAAALGCRSSPERHARTGSPQARSASPCSRRTRPRSSGIAASKKPKAGKLLPLGKNGKFPASAPPVSRPGPEGAPARPRGRARPGRPRRPAGRAGDPGPRGLKGATGPAGPQGPTGVQGLVGPPGGFGLLNLGRATVSRVSLDAGGAHSSAAPVPTASRWSRSSTTRRRASWSCTATTPPARARRRRPSTPRSPTSAATRR